LAGIYLHIPFCKQACTYCNFHFTTSLHYKNQLVDAIIKEIELQRNFLKDEPITSIYFGGGTPSLLTGEECSLLLKKIHREFFVEQNTEITLEANPDDITKEKLFTWKDAGINRLSIGIQSFFEKDLVWMNRAHTAKEAIDNLQLAKNEFNNISIDLIYGSPLLSDEQWKENVDIALGFDIPHLSCYALTVEEKTPLHKQILLKKTTDVDQDKQARQFLLLMQWLKKNGYEHYEVSNFAKPGFRSRHNSAYWQGKKYLGLGPSAHSYDGIVRKWNVANNAKYMEGIHNGVTESETEILSEVQKLNEYIMISLRTMEGLDLEKVKLEWGEEKVNNMEKKISFFKNNNLLTQKEMIIKLTDEGMLRADGIAADLFTVEFLLKTDFSSKPH
jgi:oxygen-independent coproporphyrinogen-3 oxidase